MTTTSNGENHAMITVAKRIDWKWCQIYISDVTITRITHTSRKSTENKIEKPKASKTAVL